jgi:hypothetical protein
MSAYYVFTNRPNSDYKSLEAALKGASERTIKDGVVRYIAEVKRIVARSYPIVVTKVGK